MAYHRATRDIGTLNKRTRGRLRSDANEEEGGWGVLDYDLGIFSFLELRCENLWDLERDD